MDDHDGYAVRVSTLVSIWTKPLAESRHRTLEKAPVVVTSDVTTSTRHLLRYGKPFVRFNLGNC